MTKILDLANDFSTFYKKYNNEIIEHVLVENSVIDGGIIGNTAISTADILIDNTTIRFATTRVLQPDDLLTYDETQFKFINKSVAELGFVTPDTLINLTPNTIVANTISVTGDLIVSGNTTTLDTQTLLVEDNIVVFGSNNVADITDLGFAVKYSDGSDKYAGIFRDATDKKFYVFQNYNLEPPTSTLTGFNVNSMKGTLVGDFEAVTSLTTPLVTTDSDLDITAPDGNITLTADLDITIDASSGGNIFLRGQGGAIFAKGNVLPETSGWNIGSSSKPWNNIHADDITLNTAAITYNTSNGTLDVSGNALAYQSDVTTLIENSYTSFTANENINAGNSVSILSNSLIENIKRTSIAGSGFLNFNFTPITFLTKISYLSYDKTLAKLLVCYHHIDSGNITRYKAVLATIDALGNITFGNEIEITSTSAFTLTGSPKGAIDPLQNRAVFIFLGNVYVAEISGNNLINLQSPVQFNSGGWYYSDIIYHSNTEQFVLAYAFRSTQDILKLRTAKVTNNTITFGTEFDTNQSLYSGFDNINLSIDKDTNKVIVGWRSGSSLRCAIASISGTSISIPLSGSTIVYFEVYNSTYAYTKLIYTSNGTIVAVFGDAFDSNRPYYSIGTISGNSITFGTKVLITTEAIADTIGLAYDSVKERIAINHRGSNGNLGLSIGVIENGTINFETIFQDGTVGTSWKPLYLTVDETNNFFIAGQESLVYSYEGNSFSTNIDKFIGIAKDTIAQGQTGQVYVVGDIADNQTGLLPGEYYYLKNDGTLSTTSTSYGLAGIALTSTSIKLLQALPNSLTDLNIADGSIGEFLKTNGQGSFNFSSVDYNNLINKPDAQLQAIADDAFVNSIIFG